MFSKILTTKSKAATMETSGDDRVIKPLLCVALLAVFLAGCILGRSEDPRAEADHYELFKHTERKSFSDILYEQIYKIVSVPLFATVFFGWVCGSFADEHGRVRAIQLFFLLSGIGFGFLLFSEEYDYALLGSFILGGAFGCSVPAPIYIAEISPVRYRSFILALVPLFLSLGIFSMDVIELCLAESTAWKGFCWTCVAGFLLSFSLHEAPEWLVMRNRPDAAIESIKWVSETPDVDHELRKLQELSISKNERSDCTLEMIFQAKVWKPFAMIIGFALFQHLAGFYIMVYYAPYLVNMYRTNIYLYSTIIGTDFLILVASAVALVFQANFNRKTVAIMSGMSSAVALLGLSLHAHYGLLPNAPLPPSQRDMLIPVFFFSMYVISAVVGIYTLPWVMIFEIFPLRYRGVLCGLTFSAMYFGLYLFDSRLNNYLVEFLDYSGLLCLFIIGSLGFAIYAHSTLVETNKKSFDEIERKFTKQRIFLPTNEKI